MEHVIDGCAPLDRTMDDESSGAPSRHSPTTLTSSHRGSSGIPGRSLRLPPRPPVSASSRLRRSAGRERAASSAGSAPSASRVGPGTAGPISGLEWERVRTVPYLTERVLAASLAWPRSERSPACSMSAVDGSGYPRGCAAPRSRRRRGCLPPLRSIRRCARTDHIGWPFPPEARPSALLKPRRAVGRCGCDAVLKAAGHRVRRRPNLTGGLSAREAEIAELLVHGIRTETWPRRYLSRRGRSAATSSTSITRLGSRTRIARRCTRCATGSSMPSRR